MGSIFRSAMSDARNSARGGALTSAAAGAREAAAMRTATKRERAMVVGRGALRGQGVVRERDETPGCAAFARGKFCRADELG